MNLERLTLTYKKYWGHYWRTTHFHSIPGISRKIEQTVELIETACGLKPGAEILDLGCAGGDHLKVFARKGYKVTGIDFVPSLIEYARESFTRAALPGEFIISDMRDMDYKESFDLIYMLSGVFDYIDDAAGREFLKKVRRALKPGGLVFIDYMPVERYLTTGHARTWTDIEGGYSLAEEWFDVPTSTYRSRHMHIFLDGRIIESAEDGCATEILRCYTAREMELLATDAGFTVTAHLTRNHIGNPGYIPKEDEPRGMIVARKGTEI